MAHGLEVRVPFLDRDLVRFAFSIPWHLKVKRQQTQVYLPQGHDWNLPAHTLRKKKWGFSFNPYHQFQKDLKQVAEQVLTRQRVEARGWFNLYLHASYPRSPAFAAPPLALFPAVGGSGLRDLGPDVSRRRCQTANAGAEDYTPSR